MSLSFKFVTSGQPVDDAAILSQTVYGRSLLPLPPANISGIRNHITSLGDDDGDLVISWTRRSRIAPGLRPNADVPIAEESEAFDIEIMSGGTVKHTISVRNSAPVLLPLYTALPEFGLPGDTGFARSDFRFDPFNSFMEWTLEPGIDTDPEGTLSGAVDLYDYDFKTRRWRVSYSAATPTSGTTTTWNLTVEGLEGGGTLYSGSVTSANKIRQRLQILNGELLFFDDMKALNPPVYRSPTQPSTYGLLAPQLVFNSTLWTVGGLKKAIGWTSHRYAALYSADLQTSHFGSIQSSLTARIYQVSAIIGRGPYTQATI